MKPFRIPEGLLMGSATAAIQIEGGDRNNSWFRWCEEGHIKDGSSTLRGTGHWSRVEEDTALLVRLNQRIYRMGLEWSRIEPEKGTFSEEAMAHYRTELLTLRRNGIQPLITLHHFSDPIWFTREGGFENPDSIRLFDRYVSYVVQQLGDLTGEFVTINEPNVYVTNGYYYGTWPPGKKDLKLALTVFRNLIGCHITAYRTIHRIRAAMGFEGESQVGSAFHLRVFIPYTSGLQDAVAAKAMDYLFQSAVVRGMTEGLLLPPIGIGRPYGKGPFCDFLGINYYTRSAVHFKGFSYDSLPGTPRNDLDWEIYPQGVSELCRRFYRQYHKPIWITENGTCDRADAFRSRFIYDHLKSAADLIGEGIPIERYYHWSLLDNFEWLDGEAAPFGLVAVDFETLERRIRRSGMFYGEICSQGGVTEKMIREYLLG